MRLGKRLYSSPKILIHIIIVLFMISGCKNNFTNEQNSFSAVLSGLDRMPDSFMDVHGITDDEIKAIKALQNQNRTFIYGMPLSTEAFEDENGNVRGFTAILCSWMSDFFGLTFQPRLMEWPDLIEGLETGEVSFTGELTKTLERLQIYYMTSDIASRPIKYYRLSGSRTLDEIRRERLPRCGFIEGANTINTVTAEFERGSYETVMLSDISLVYDALKSGSIDVFYYSGAAEANFLQYSDITANHFYPLTYRPVSLSTQDPALLPVISIMEKLLENGGIRYLTLMYNQGHREYMSRKFILQLTEEELSYINSKPFIPVGIDPGNYPGSFYDTREGEWKGISLDILNEIESLTGIRFQRVNDEKTGWPEIYEMLINGDIALISELIPTHDRAGLFLWPASAQMKDYYALISRSDYPDIKENEILYVNVGLAKDTAYQSIFNKWFPNHMNTKEYETMEDALKALRRGEVEMVLANQKRILYLTHYLELPYYKTNIVFDYDINTNFGINIKENILCSVIDKALGIIDTEMISNHWMRQTYDYRIKVAQARFPWLLGSSVLLLSVLALLFILIMKYRREGIKLEGLVQERTAKLNKYKNELEHALENAKAANNSKTVFLANMSHEIRTPMNSIMGFSELAFASETSPVTKDYLDKIRANIEWLLQIINDILDITKIESGKMELEKIPFYIHELFVNCRTLVMPKAVEKGIILHFYAEPSVGKRPLGDPTRLRQIFVNLLSNAIKFTNSGMVKLLSDVTSAGDDFITMHFEIKDSGIGMTSEQIEKIFEPFTQGETNITRKYGGSGLGLAITKNIVEMMGGKLFVESTPGIGSKFSFDITFETVPITENELLEKKLTYNEIEKPVFEGEVMICEDNDMNQFVISEHLKRVGLKTVVAENGKVCMEHIRKRMENGEKLFDLIFMDMHMPVMDGFEASAEIAKLNADIPMVAMTANVMLDDLEIYKASGLLDCLGKPFTSQELWRCLLRYFKPLNYAD